MKKAIVETMLAAFIAASIFGTATCTKQDTGTATPNPNDIQNSQQTPGAQVSETELASKHGCK